MLKKQPAPPDGGRSSVSPPTKVMQQSLDRWLWIWKSLNRLLDESIARLTTLESAKSPEFPPKPDTSRYESYLVDCIECSALYLFRRYLVPKGWMFGVRERRKYTLDSAPVELVQAIGAGYPSRSRRAGPRSTQPFWRPLGQYLGTFFSSFFVHYYLLIFWISPIYWHCYCQSAIGQNQ